MNANETQVLVVKYQELLKSKHDLSLKNYVLKEELKTQMDKYNTRNTLKNRKHSTVLLMDTLRDSKVQDIINSYLEPVDYFSLTTTNRHVYHLC